MNLVIRAERQQMMPLHISTLQICLTRRDNHYQVVRHPPEALIQFHGLAAPFKMNKLDPQILQIGSLLT
jgi:hypothetical protein